MWQQAPICMKAKGENPFSYTEATRTYPCTLAHPITAGFIAAEAPKKAAQTTPIAFSSLHAAENRRMRDGIGFDS